MAGLEYTPEVARRAVERGARWLDKQCPDWISHIRVERLRLENSTYCVLGQTAKPFGKGNYEVLTLTWREYIRERLAVQA